MQAVNLWIALTQNAYNTLRPLLDDSEYAGPHLTAVKIFRRMADLATVEKMFKTPTIGGKVWHMFSVYFADLDGDQAAKLQQALTYLENNYPAQFEVVGAWWWDGRQIGTQWVDENDHSLGTTGTPLYPVHPQVVKFMPDVWDMTDPENPVAVPATQPTDVNLLQGQAQRRFT